MKRNVRILSLTSIVFFLAVAVSAQTRVVFLRGATGVTVTGRLNGFNSARNYAVRVKRGQTLRVEQLGPGSRRVTLAITGPAGEDASDMDASCNNRKSVSPTRRGDYLITVRECMKADPWRGTFRLRIRVTGY